MAVADGSRTRLAYVAEATIGTIPTTPVFQVMRYVSEGIRLMKTTAVPDEIRADRNVTDIVDTGRAVEGPINTLLSYGTHDALFEALFCSTWSTNVLKNGITDKAFTFEKTFEQGSTDTFIRYRGCRVNSLELQLTARQFISANFGILGIGSPTPTTAIVSGATYTAATTKPVMNAGLDLGTITMTGTSATPKIQSATINITNNIAPVDVLGQYEPYAHILGRFDVTGTITALFEDFDLYGAILDHDDLGLTITIGSTTTEKYTLEIPVFKGLDGGPVVGGNGQAVLIEMPFQAKFSSDDSASIILTRAVA